MSAPTEWDAIYAAGEQMTRWPWSDLVSLVKRHMPELEGKRVLELGCGALANMPFFIQEDADYFGIDASSEVVRRAAYLCVSHGDFTQSIPDGPYDLICDRAAVCHNERDAIERCLRMALNALKPGGLYIGIDWFSTEHHDDAQFEGLTVHRCSGIDMRSFFRAFDILSMEEKIVRRVQPARPQFASWNIVARKP